MLLSTKIFLSTLVLFLKSLLLQFCKMFLTCLILFTSLFFSVAFQSKSNEYFDSFFYNDY